MRTFYIEDEAGDVVEMGNRRAWAYWMASHDRRVAWSDLGEKGTVSTVFLGINHNFGGMGEPPLLYETMVFGGAMDGCVLRTSSRAAALRGHEGMVAQVEDPLPNPLPGGEGTRGRG